MFASFDVRCVALEKSPHTDQKQDDVPLEAAVAERESTELESYAESGETQKLELVERDRLALELERSRMQENALEAYIQVIISSVTVSKHFYSPLLIVIAIENIDVYSCLWQ